MFHPLYTSARWVCIALAFAVVGHATLAAAQDGAKPLRLVAGRSDGAVQPDGGRYALIIGIDDYSQAQLGGLKFAERDAQALRDSLVAFGGFPEQNVTLFLGPQATLANILHYLDNLSEPRFFPQADTFLLYFSGHGGLIRSLSAGPNSQNASDQFLVPADGTSDAVMAQHQNIPLADVMRALDASVFKRKVLLLDACRIVLTTNGAKPVGVFSAFNLQQYASARGTKGMAGTLPGKLSWEDASLGDDQLGYGHGVFSYYLLSGLDGMAADSNGVVTFNGLDEYLAGAMAQYSRDHPDKAQSPQPFGEGNGGIPLSLADPGLATALANTGAPPAGGDDESDTPAHHLSKLGREFLSQNQFEEAIDAFAAAFRQTPDDPGKQPGIGVSWPPSVQAKLATACQEKLRANPQDAVLWCLLGDMKVSISATTRESIEPYTRALQLAPTWAFPHYMLGLAYSWMPWHGEHPRSQEETQNTQHAIDEFQRALKLNPRLMEDSPFESPHGKLGELYVGLQDFAAAAAEYQTIIQLFPQKSEGYEALGDVYLAQGKFDAAIAQYQICQQLDPQADWSSWIKKAQDAKAAVGK